MGVTWTREQEQVINTRDRDMLVSAAAGSGKTAVLVARILALITDAEHPVDIDRLLVVTFTRAAAGEMRDRISSAIEERLQADPENEHLQRQSVLLHNAKISTIHGFCTYVIQNYFFRTDLDPAYRIAEEGELKEVRGTAVKELLEEEYQTAAPDFLSFTETFAPGKNDQKLEEVIQRVSDYAMANPDPQAWLDACNSAVSARTEEQLLETDWMQETLAEAERILAGVRQAAEENRRIAASPGGPAYFIPTAEADLELIDELTRCSTYTELQRAFAEMKFATLARKKKTDADADPDLVEQFRTGREQLKKMLKDMKEKQFADTIEEILADLQKIRPMIGELTRLAAAFEARFSEKKRARNIVDFIDLEHYALRILTEKQEDGWHRTEVAGELAEQFAEIMIDEYQDSNLLQETLLAAVSGEQEGRHNRFMVGDMKQSIYGFRMARPELFLEKYAAYPPLGETGDREQSPASCRITLGKNFRSRPQVLDFANAVFEKLMWPDLGGIRYDADAALYQGAVFPEEPDCCAQMEAAEDSVTQMETAAGNCISAGTDEEYPMPDHEDPYRTELLLLNKEAPEFDDDRSRETMMEAEAMLVAGRIRKLVRSGKVCDKITGNLRPVEYRDIVILQRAASSSAAVYVRVLQSVGIPAYATSRKGYFSATEVVLVLNYLRILENPLQDIPFAAVLRSPMCGCTDEELALLRAACPEGPVYDAVVQYAAKEDGACTEAPAENESAALQEKLAGFLRLYEQIREKVPYSMIHEIVQEVLDRTGYGLFAAAMPAGEQRAANLKMLVETAVNYEQTSYHGLFQFIRYIEQMGSYDVDYGEVNLFGEGENTVRIMTIHKSKGLEFPIVFLTGLAGRFNQKDLNHAVLLHARFGIGTDAVDLETRTKRSSLLHRSIRNMNRRDMLGEELRVLYVALTRAKEKLILTSTVSSPEDVPAVFSDRTLSYMQRSGAGSYLDWILMALSPETPVDVSLVEPADIGLEEMEAEHRTSERLANLRELVIKEGRGQVSEVSGSADESVPVWRPEAQEEVSVPESVDPDLYAFLEAKAAFRYPFKELAELPAKLSVSEIKKRSIEEQMEEKGLELYQEAPVIPLIPDFIKQAEAADTAKESANLSASGDAQSAGAETFTGAARGTIYHQILAALDLPRISGEKDLQNQIEEMTADGRLTAEEADAVEMADLLQFLKSPVGIRMKKAAEAGTLVREQPFVIDIPADTISGEYETSEPILVQGVIDAYFEEDGEYVIVDYKTDRVKYRDGRDLAEKYRIQLLYYKHALEQILDIHVKEMYLYSITLGREILV